jgi:CheY-like chemotaxis protein
LSGSHPDSSVPAAGASRRIGGDRMKRIMVAAEDVEFAIDATAALEQAGHRVTHLFDLTEAALQAQLTQPDAFVVDLVARRIDHGPLRRFAAESSVPLIITGVSPASERLARRLGGVGFVRPAPPAKVVRASTRRNTGRQTIPDAEMASIEISGPTTVRGGWTTAFVDVVETAIATAVAPEGGSSHRSGTLMIAPTVLIAAASDTVRAITASLVRSDLGLKSLTAADAASAVAALGERRVRAVLLDGAMLRLPGGDELLRAIEARGLPVIGLLVGSQEEPSMAGRAAWDAIPKLREALRRTKKAKGAAR